MPTKLWTRTVFRMAQSEPHSGGASTLRCRTIRWLRNEPGVCGIVIRDNRLLLFCGTCEVFLSAKTRALVKQHVWGVQCPDEARKAAMAAGTFKEHTEHMTIIAAETVNRAEDAWAFWGLLKRQGETCSAWTRAAARVALLLPSSTDVERFFSTAGGTTKRTQMALSEDNQEIRHLLAYIAERPL
jgi:hypothetical protein